MKGGKKSRWKIRCTLKLGCGWRAALLPSTFLPAAVATERDWGIPIVEPSSAAWGGLACGGCLR